MRPILVVGASLLTACMVATPVRAEATADAVTSSESMNYLIQPGDVLQISVWHEPDLQLELMVRPDGGVSGPLLGEVQASGKPVAELRTEVTEKFRRFIPDAEVTVAVKQATGNKVYVIGKVNRPGEFVLNRQVDVMQALAIAGGTTPFAEVNDILVLRRIEGQQSAIPFRYSQVESGRHLEQNIELQSGDVVVVP